MKKMLMGLAGLGMLVMGSVNASASPLSTGTNLVTPDTGVSSLIDQVRHRYGHRNRGRHLGWYKGNRGRHLGWYRGHHRGWGGGHGWGHGHGRWR